MPSIAGEMLETMAAQAPTNLDGPIKQATEVGEA